MPGKLSFYTLLLISCSLFVACHRDATGYEKVNRDTTGLFRIVKLAPGKEKKAGFQYIKPESCIISNMVTCKGVIAVSPGCEIMVPAPAAGNIKSLFIQPGQYVNAGMIVATITNTDFIRLQQELLEARYQYVFLKEEYTRQGELTIENATSLKNMQVAQRDYLSAEVRLKSISLQLGESGINPDSVRPERIFTDIPVFAKTSGYVTSIAVNQGTWIDKGKPLFVLINKNHIQVEVKIPGEYLHYLQLGQELTYHFSFDSTTIYKAQLKIIMPEVDPLSGAGCAYATPAGNAHVLFPGMPVDIRLSAGTDTAFFISPEAIVETPAGLCVIARNHGSFFEIPVLRIDADKHNNCFSGIPTCLSDSLVVSGTEFLVKIFHHH